MNPAYRDFAPQGDARRAPIGLYENCHFERKFKIITDQGKSTTSYLAFQLSLYIQVNYCREVETTGSFSEHGWETDHIVNLPAKNEIPFHNCWLGTGESESASQVLSMINGQPYLEWHKTDKNFVCSMSYYFSSKSISLCACVRDHFSGCLLCAHADIFTHRLMLLPLHDKVLASGYRALRGGPRRWCFIGIIVRSAFSSSSWKYLAIFGKVSWLNCWLLQVLISTLIQRSSTNFCLTSISGEYITRIMMLEHHLRDLISQVIFAISSSHIRCRFTTPNPPSQIVSSLIFDCLVKVSSNRLRRFHPLQKQTYLDSWCSRARAPKNGLVARPGGDENELWKRTGRWP